MNLSTSNHSDIIHLQLNICRAVDYYKIEHIGLDPKKEICDLFFHFIWVLCHMKLWITDNVQMMNTMYVMQESAAG